MDFYDHVIHECLTFGSRVLNKQWIVSYVIW